MKISATTMLLAAALGVAAHPSGVAHRHAHKRMEVVTEYATVTKFVKAGRPSQTPIPPPPPANDAVMPPAPPIPQASVVPSAAPAPQASVVPSAAPAPQAPPSPGSGSSGGGSGVGPKQYTPFCSGQTKRATAEEIAYKGNTGTANNFGCNLMLVSTSIVDQYKYSILFEDNSGQDQKCTCWNKYSKDNKLDGGWKDKSVLLFDLPANSKQAMVADKNSQGACVCGAGELPIAPNGQYAGAWVEFDFCNESNGGWSGADASALVSAREGQPIQALKVCDEDNKQCSIINADGSGTNAYLKGMEDVDGTGLQFTPGKAHLVCTVS